MKHPTSSNKLIDCQHANTIFSSRWNGETFRTLPQSFRRDVPSACYPPGWRLISSLNIGRWMFSIPQNRVSATRIIYSIIIHKMHHIIIHILHTLYATILKRSVWYTTCDTFTARPLPWVHPRRRRPMNGRPPPWRYARRGWLRSPVPSCWRVGTYFSLFFGWFGVFFHLFRKGFGYNLI